jgi:hypothetical protein
VGTEDRNGSAGRPDKRQADKRPREDTVFPEDFRKLMRRIFGPWAGGR